MTSIRTALVIGGGITGPVAAMALRRAGIEPTVYEAYPGTAKGVGAMLTLAPNGLDALRAVGADEAVRAVGRPMDRTVMADGRGRRLGTLPGLPGLPPSLALWRSELCEALRDRALADGVRYEHGKRLVDAEDGPGGVTAAFADGGTATGDVLIGADGIGSTVRTLIDPDAPGPGDVPLLNFGGATDFTAPGEPGVQYFVFGKKGFLGYWLDPDGGTAWFANLPERQAMTAARAREVTAAEWLRRLAGAYAGDVPGRDLIAATDPGRLAVLGSTQIMPSAPRWHRGAMVLAGDSAHAPSPGSGQGASLAAESAVELARCLRDLPDVPAAFAAYEALRRPRVVKIAARAARTNDAKALGPVALAMMKLMMPVATRTFLTPERTLGLEQRHRIDWDSPAGAPAG